MKTTTRLAAIGFGLGVIALGLVSPADAAPQKKASPAKTASVTWSTNYNASLAQAKRTKKPLFIDFSTEWCEGCKILDTKTFRDPQFIAASRNWVMVRVNPEKSDVGTKLGRDYRVTGFPTLVFADSNGKLINQVVGSYPASMLVPRMSAAQRQLQAERVASTR